MRCVYIIPLRQYSTKAARVICAARLVFWILTTSSKSKVARLESTFFVKKANISNAPVGVKCRIDHYQTPTQVHVSVFAKKVVKDQSSVKFDTEQVHLDLVFPDNRRFIHTLNLFGPISPAASSCTYFGTKVELLLLKEDNRSWNMLEKPLDDSALPPGYTITFGVGGRTGSIGAKAAILDDNNQLK